MDICGKNASVLVLNGGLSNIKDLCIAAHPDDAEIMAYGQIAACYKNGGFAVAVLTNGGGSPRAGAYADITDEEMKEIRFKEQINAALIGNYSALFWLGYSSADVKTGAQSVKNDIATIFLETTPERVFIHNLADKHDTHVASALRSIDALRKVKDEFRPSKIYMMEVWRGLDWVGDGEKTLFDTSLYPELAEKILNVYESQISGGKEYTKATVGRRFANATFLESHSVDNLKSASLGIDITDFVYSEDDPCDFISGYVDSFRNDVTSRISKYK